MSIETVPRRQRASTADDVRRALAARAKADERIGKHLRNLPAGTPEQRTGFREAKRAGIGATEIARLSGLTRSRVNQLIT